MLKLSTQLQHYLRAQFNKQQQYTTCTMKHILRLVNYYKNAITSKHNQHFLTWRFGLYQRPSSEEVINWPAATILDKELDKSTRWIKDEVHIQKEGRQSLNWDEGSYTLSHTYDRFLAMSHHYRGKNRKSNWTNFFRWRSLIESETSG